jgi:uncharacterized protein (TIGR00251 family)
MFYDKQKNGYILRIRVTPNSSVLGILGKFIDINNQTFLKIGINSSPEKGKANQELIKLLSKSLKIAKSSFSIIQGQTERYKKLELTIPPSEELDNLLNSLGA